jgi:hypothetical protein
MYPHIHIVLRPSQGPRQEDHQVKEDTNELCQQNFYWKRNPKDVVMFNEKQYEKENLEEMFTRAKDGLKSWKRT